jgi:predicted nucleic acid-binding protein
MGVVVFDSDVLIGFLNRDDAHHEAAIHRVTDAIGPGHRRLLCAVNYAEIMVGPARVGDGAPELVSHMLAQFNIETITVDKDLAGHAAAVRARTGVKLPDAFALATALHGEQHGWDDVELASFDRALLKAHAQLRPR